jgi:acyl-CoA thioesterase-2
METVLTGEPFERPDFQPGREALIRMWIRCPGSVDVTPRDAQIVLAYVSDTVLLMPSVIPHGLPFTTHRMASIDHSVWFHGIPDVADWMLYDLCSSAAIDGRGMNHGTLFDRAGRLLLTAAQESMLRRN